MLFKLASQPQTGNFTWLGNQCNSEEKEVTIKVIFLNNTPTLFHKNVLCTSRTYFVQNFNHNCSLNGVRAKFVSIREQINVVIKSLNIFANKFSDKPVSGSLVWDNVFDNMG